MPYLAPWFKRRMREIEAERMQEATPMPTKPAEPSPEVAPTQEPRCGGHKFTILGKCIYCDAIDQTFQDMRDRAKEVVHKPAVAPRETQPDGSAAHPYVTAAPTPVEHFCEYCGTTPCNCTDPNCSCRKDNPLPSAPAESQGVERAQPETREKRLEDALRMLYEETKEYIEINRLGDPHHNQAMKMARAALGENL